MCVQTKGLPWERPAVAEDAAILGNYFPDVDFESARLAMSEHGFRPLVADMLLLGAIIHADPDDLGARYVPFSGLDHNHQVIVKILEMDHVVDWFENTALGPDMWELASDWTERRYGARIRFAMNCGCGLVPVPAFTDGRWHAWLRRFNSSRRDVYGRTLVEVRDSIVGTDIRPDQLLIWHRIRAAVQAMPEVSRYNLEVAA